MSIATATQEQSRTAYEAVAKLQLALQPYAQGDAGPGRKGRLTDAETDALVEDAAAALLPLVGS